MDTMKQEEIRQLDRLEVAQVYSSFMQEDFPPNELKPLKRIEEMLDQGIYECIGLFSEGQMAAYAFFVKQDETGYYLLDYLAVGKAHRGEGYGSIFMKGMGRYFKDCKGIFLECESEVSLGTWTEANHQTAMQRNKRIQFYCNNGAMITNIKSELFGVDYTILYYLIQKNTVDAYAEMKAIYKIMFPDSLWGNRVKLWERHQALLFAGQVEPSAEGFCLKPKVSLCDALGIHADLAAGKIRMIALCGGGGKTATMYQLADELAEMGKKVLVTTSTHIAMPKSGQAVLIQDGKELEGIAWESNILTAGRPLPGAEQQKLAGPEHLERGLEYADIVLVEADGSRQFPVKVMNDGEPVIPAQADLVIGCLGLRAVGRSFAETCFRFDSFGGWLRKQPEDVVRPEDLAVLFQDERAVRKGVGDKPYRMVLNQADDEAARQAAVEVAGHLDGTIDGYPAVTAYDKGQSRQNSDLNRENYS